MRGAGRGDDPVAPVLYARPVPGGRRVGRGLTLVGTETPRGAAAAAPFAFPGPGRSDGRRRLMAEYANPDALVETDWLEANVNDPGIQVIEVDEDTEAYEKGHIEGAVGWNWTTDLHADVGRDYVDQAGQIGRAHV